MFAMLKVDSMADKFDIDEASSAVTKQEVCSMVNEFKPNKCKSTNVQCILHMHIVFRDETPI